jgi:co-chaperonin GroES (HSP10)
MKTIHYIALKQIEPERAEKYIGKVQIDLSISRYSADNVFWTNTMFEDPQTGDKVFVTPQAAATVFGSFDNTKSEGQGYTMEDGTIIRFFRPSEIYLRITPQGKYIPKEGYAIAEKIKKPEVKTFLSFPESHNEGEYEERFILRYLGAPAKTNRTAKMNASTVVEVTGYVPRLNSVVVTGYGAGIPLFSEMNLKLDKQYVMVPYDSIMGELMNDGSVMPIGDRVLVGYKLQMEQGGILLPKPKESRAKVGVVLATGEDCKIVKIGDEVSFGKNWGWRGEPKGNDVELILMEKELFYVKN